MYVVVLATLNALVWLRTIVPAVLSDSPAAFLEGSGVTTNPVFVQDLALWLPVLVMSAMWLWRGRPLGQLVVGAMLVMLLLESIGVAADQWFGAMADSGTPFASMGAVPVFVALAVVGAVPLFFYLRHLDSGRRYRTWAAIHTRAIADGRGTFGPTGTPPCVVQWNDQGGRHHEHFD